jgi:hypothetical protein
MTKLTDKQRECLKVACYSSVYKPEPGPYRKRGELDRRGCFPGPTIRSLAANDLISEIFPGSYRITSAGRSALSEQGTET